MTHARVLWALQDRSLSIRLRSAGSNDSDSLLHYVETVQMGQGDGS